MKNFFLYFHYRVYQFYEASMRSDGPVGLFIGLNISLILNIILRLGNQLSPIPHTFSPIGPALIVLDGLILLLASVITTPIVIYRNKKFLLKKIDEFKKEGALREKGKVKK